MSLQPLRQWWAERDRDLRIVVLLTVVGFMVRWCVAVGYMLGDDMSYTDLIRDAIHGHWMQVASTGQYAYRPMWIYPLAASVKLFGWGTHALVLYPMVTGSLIPLLMALWLRRHLPRGSQAPLLCALILACYPTLFIDSLMLVNEVPMIFWCLVCVNLFGAAFDQLAASSNLGSRPWRVGGWSILAGLMFAAAYQVKVVAIPVLGMWLLAELVLSVRRQGWPRLAPFAWAVVAFAIPTLVVQLCYGSKLGDFLGNFHGELRLYDADLPPEYFQGRYDVPALLAVYPLYLLQLDGYHGYRIFLHGIWIYIGGGLVLLSLFGWRKIPSEPRAMATALVLVTVGCYLFLQYWPARLQPYYIPINFNGRLWRYTDVMGVTTAGAIAILLTLPVLRRHWSGQALRIAVLAAGFGVAGYCVMVRGFEFNDRARDFRQVAADREILAPYLDVPHFSDTDGVGLLRAALHFPEKPPLPIRDAAEEGVLFDFQKTGGCVWTGGMRHYDGNTADALSPEKIHAIGGELRLVHTWPSENRPWRYYSVQLWAYEPSPLSTNDHSHRN